MIDFSSMSPLRQRVLSAAILAPVVLGLVAWGGPAFALLLGVVAGIGVYEWAQMALIDRSGPPLQTPRVLGALAGLSVFIPGALDGNPYAALFFLLSISCALMAMGLFRRWKAAPMLVLGLVYVGFSCAVVIWLRGGSGVQGLFHILTLLLAVWASDTVAYVFGRTFGGPKLAPRISPKKTWSGFSGAAIGAAAVSALMASPLVAGALDADTLAGLGMLGYAVMGAALGMAGQVGDLAISVLKRRVGVKDTGALIPGHGGILDRIDALLLVSLLYGLFVAVAA